MINGRTINDKLRKGKGRLRQLLRAKTPREKIIEELYLRAYSRLPKPEEVQRLLKAFDAGNSPTQVWEDIFWAVLNSREFVFNH